MKAMQWKRKWKGTYVGTVASELEGNIEESRKTTSASDHPVYQYSLIQKNVMVMKVIMMRMVTIMYM